MDNFEKYIRANKTAFDDQQANKEKMWLNIAKTLNADTPKVIPFTKSTLFKVAASIAIILGIVTIVSLFGVFQTDTQTNYASKELLDIDSYYQNLVSYQVALLQNSPKLSDEDKTEFLSFIEELDVEHQQLRLEMQNNLDNELVLEAIVANYKKRIELIENLLKQINSSKIQDEDYGYSL